jgi:hypothetical protein
VNHVRTVVLVEGLSDKVAVDTLARRRGRHLDNERIAVVAMGGATNIGSYLARFMADGEAAHVAGLCDVGEEREFRRALERAGLGANLDRAGMEALGFYVCVDDLEDELIRALGVDAVERLIAAHGDLGLLRTFENQPAQRGRPRTAQLRRFMGTRSGRKIEYARLLVNALDLARVPPPLDQLLDSLRG